MAYEVTNPPAIIGSRVGGNSVWLYVDGDDDATVNGAGYFTNGVALGMKVGDIVLVFDTATPKASFHGVNTISGDTVTLGFGAVA